MDGNPTLDREIHRVVKRADVLVAMVKAACERAEILVESARETQQLIARRILSAERLPPPSGCWNASGRGRQTPSLRR